MFSGTISCLRKLLRKYSMYSTLSQKRWMISLLIMKCRKHSSYRMKLFIPLDECFFFSLLTMKSSIVFGTVHLIEKSPSRISKKYSTKINVWRFLHFYSRKEVKQKRGKSLKSRLEKMKMGKVVGKYPCGSIKAKLWSTQPWLLITYLHKKTFYIERLWSFFGECIIANTFIVVTVRVVSQNWVTVYTRKSVEKHFKSNVICSVILSSFR
jgi:hypothetical protein